MAERLLAEFATEEAAAAAIRRLRERDYREIEAYMPFPSHDIDDALGKRPSRLPIGIFIVGMAAAIAAYLLQWLLAAYLYPLVVGGRPPHFPLPFVIITFEMGILVAGLAAFFGTLLLGRLVRLVDEVQGTPGFESVTRDGFWVEVSTRDVRFDDEGATRLLIEHGAMRIERPEAVR
jgi:hypothetical protein